MSLFSSEIGEGEVCKAQYDVQDDAQMEEDNF